MTPNHCLDELYIYGCFQKIGVKPPKWMVYHGKPYFLMDDLGVPLFLETPIYIYIMIINISSWKPKANQLFSMDGNGDFHPFFHGNDLEFRVIQLKQAF